MSWELDNLKNKVQQIEYQTYRFIDKQDFQREKSEIDKSLSEKVSNWEFQNLFDKLDRIQERIQQIELHLNL